MNALDKVIVAFASWWGGGAKEKASRLLYGNKPWGVPVLTALVRAGVHLDGCKDPKEISDRMRWKLFYKPDWLNGMCDSTKPPEVLCREGGGDCEDWALTHALAIKAVLGWDAYVVYMVVHPLSNSHAFCIAVDPDGHTWYVDPQPTKQGLIDHPDGQNVWGPEEPSLNTIVNDICTRAHAIWHNVTKV